MTRLDTLIKTHRRIITTGIFLVMAALFLPVLAKGANKIDVVPPVFDFGWSPNNAKISADFKVKNITQSPIPNVDILPTCGCTAANFSPASLANKNESDLTLTFNTRGFDGRSFDKPTEVRVEESENPVTVRLIGRVTDEKAALQPEGSGLAIFDKESDKKNKFVIKNNSDKKMDLSIVRPASNWANVKMSDDQINPGSSITIEVKVNGSLEEERFTSLTVEGKTDSERHRMTLGIQTGGAPRPIRGIIKKAPKAPPSSGSNNSPGN